MEVEVPAIEHVPVRPPRRTDEPTAVLSPQRNASDAKVRAALLQSAGVLPEPVAEKKFVLEHVHLEPIVGPADTLPIMTPDTVVLGPAWTADFMFTALGSLHHSVTMWPELLERPWGLPPKGRGDRYWSWLRFDPGDGRTLRVVGHWALDALLAACWHRPAFILDIIDTGHYIRVPQLMIGPDRRADFPVLYRYKGAITLHTLRRRREELEGLRGCDLTAHIDRL